MGSAAVTVLREDTAEAAAGEFSHETAFYHGEDDLVRTLLPFVREGVERREPVLVALLADRAARLREALAEDANLVDFVDMAALGANPACIIPAWRRFVAANADAGPLRGVGEPAWCGRREPELAEADLHEALLNLAFDGGPPWRLLCPYDADNLPDDVLEAAVRNHPHRHDGGVAGLPYDGAERARRLFAEPLPVAADEAFAVDFGDGEFAGVRSTLRRICETAGISAGAAADLVLAAHELVANSVVHGGGRGTLAVWQEPDALVVEVRDAGRIDDPLVGRHLVDPGAPSGRGIWMANQLCDLVQVRSGPSGTQVRLRVWR